MNQISKMNYLIVWELQGPAVNPWCRAELVLICTCTTRILQIKRRCVLKYEYLVLIQSTSLTYHDVQADSFALNVKQPSYGFITSTIMRVRLRRSIARSCWWPQLGLRVAVRVKLKEGQSSRVEAINGGLGAFRQRSRQFSKMDSLTSGGSHFHVPLG